MHYLVDGYNLLFRVCHKTSSLQSRRELLITLLDQQLAFLKGRCSLIFDSSEQLREAPECASFANLDVTYTPRNLTADHYIIELVEQSSSPKTLTIVTSDRDLARACRSIGAHTLTVEAFLSLIAKKNHPKGESKSPVRSSQAEIERLREIFERRLDNPDF